jgi:hypothetical protein
MTGRRLSAAAAAVLASVLLVAAARSAPPRTQTGPVVIQTGHGGFAWRDAAIGAVAAIGLALAVAGVLTLKGDRRVP